MIRGDILDIKSSASQEIGSLYSLNQTKIMEWAPMQKSGQAHGRNGYIHALEHMIHKVLLVKRYQNAIFPTVLVIFLMNLGGGRGEERTNILLAKEQTECPLHVRSWGYRVI